MNTLPKREVESHAGDRRQTSRAALERRSRKYGNVLLATALAGLIGFFDYATGYDFHVTAAYLVPICWSTRAAGRVAGLLVAAMCAAIWLIADNLSGHPYNHPAIPYWNAMVLMTSFAVVVWLLSAFQQRAAALEAEIVRRKSLEEANLRAERLATVGVMAAQVAHEVRNPLGSITLNLDLIAKEIEKLSGATPHSGEEGRVLVNGMREEVHRIRSVIDDYLRFAKLPKPERKPLKLNDFLDQKLAFMGSAFENARVELRTDFEASQMTVEADAEQLWQAILNLLQNSLEAMPNGGVLAVSTRQENGQARLQVSDSGKGMTAEQQRELFVPFLTTKPHGTGLGLPLTQKILTEHGAQIECASTLGKGTTFTIFFPLGGQT